MHGVFLFASSAESGVVLSGDLVRAAFCSPLFPPQTRDSGRPRGNAEDNWESTLREVTGWVADTERWPQQGSRNRTEKRLAVWLMNQQGSTHLSDGQKASLTTFLQEHPSQRSQGVSDWENIMAKSLNGFAWLGACPHRTQRIHLRRNMHNGSTIIGNGAASSNGKRLRR